MGDIYTSSGDPATTNGLAESIRAIAPPQSSSPAQGIRGPRMIMAQRAEREARRAAERENAERLRLEQQRVAAEQEKQQEEAVLLKRQADIQREEQYQRQKRQQLEDEAQEAQLPSAQPAVFRDRYPLVTTAQQMKRIDTGIIASAAAAAARGGVGGQEPPDPVVQRRRERAEAKQAGVDSKETPLRTTRVSSTSRRSVAAPIQTQSHATGAESTAMVHGETGDSSTTEAFAAGQKPRNTFPHAFERWEALSAHWEGMTSFWVRKLQENTKELERNPVSTQLSRQVGDLSAAGANLFHAVVELQRLRASSERKFQRWFFETRTELERSQEANAVLRKTVEEERRSRQTVIDKAVHEAMNNSQEKAKVAKQLAEARKELIISKEEARRAWEELGRREEDERHRTMTLQSGLPTQIGGVEVVPMNRGVPSRQVSARNPQSQMQPGQQAGFAVGQSPYAHVGSNPQQYQHAQQVEHISSMSSGAGPSYPGYPWRPADNDDDDDTDDNDTIHEYVRGADGRCIRDEHGERYRMFASPSPSPKPGRAIVEEDDGGEEYATPTESAQQPTPTTSYPPSSSHYATAYGAGESSSSSVDYSGQGYGNPIWEAVSRHHHPTRLSDVIEEDERSRTSTSQVSRA